MFIREELTLLDSISASFSRRAKHATILNFNEFIKEWFDFIAEVEEGYSMTIDDYTNDLTQRDLIDELLQQVPEDLKNRVIKLIEPSDVRFKNATKILRKSLSSSKNPPWWRYRLPKKLVGELKEDVESLKIV